MTPPKLAVQALVLQHHLTGGLTFQVLHQLTDREMRRDRHKQVDMIMRDVASNYLHFLGLAEFTEQVSHTLRYLASHHWLSVFRYPYQVIFDIIYTVARPTIGFHTESILKSSPKGEGFSPIPRLGHEKFIGLKLPAIIDGLLQGLYDTIRNGQAIKEDYWENILDLSKWVVDQERNEKLRWGHYSDLDPGWGWTRKRICEFIKGRIGKKTNTF